MNSNEIRERLLRDESVREKIHRRAYEIYVKRGGGDGRAQQDWLQAEAEILTPLLEAEMQRLTAMQVALEEPAPVEQARTSSTKTTKRSTAKAVTKEAKPAKKAASAKTTAKKTTKTTKPSKATQA